MKKGVLVSMIVAVGLFLIGAVIAGIGFAMNDWSFEGYPNEEYTECRFDASAEEVSALMVELKNENVEVTVSADGDAHIICWESEHKGYNIYIDGSGTLNMSEKKRQFSVWPLFGGWGADERTVTIELPESLDGELTVKAKNGKLTADGVSVGGMVTLVTNNGAVNASELTCGGGVKVKSNNGEIALNTVTASGSLNAETDNGRITLSGVTAGGIDAQADNGKIIVKDTAADIFSAETDNGSIELERLDALVIELSADAGSIKGTLVGGMEEYSIDSCADTGSNNLPDHRSTSSGSRELHAETDEGRIEIDFIG